MLVHYFADLFAWKACDENPCGKSSKCVQDDDHAARYYCACKCGMRLGTCPPNDDQIIDCNLEFSENSSQK